MKLPVIPEEARLAIAKGIEDEHAITMLEPLGASTRMLNLLEGGGFLTMQELMSADREKILAIKNFGDKQFVYLFECLSKYSKHYKKK